MNALTWFEIPTQNFDRAVGFYSTILAKPLETTLFGGEPLLNLPVVYYLADGRVRGVLLWNTWDQVDAARTLIAEPGPLRPADLRGRISSP